MTLPIPDHISALRAFLLADPQTAALIGTRVFGDTLPRQETNLMPRACVVIRSAGGPGTGETIALADNRVDVRCFGANAVEAAQVYRTIFTALKWACQRASIGDTLIHSVTPEAGPISLTEPEAGWPFILSSWRVKLALVGIA